METRVDVFTVYAHDDEELMKRLKKQLIPLRRQYPTTDWHYGEIEAGTEWAKEIDIHLNTAHIILLLVSPGFMASDYCYDIGMKRAMERHEAGEASVIPISLRPVNCWETAPFGKLKALPKNAKPVTTWKNRDEAFFDVAEGVQTALEKLISY